MTIGNKTLSVFKLISLGLILVCFILMFLPWMQYRGEYSYNPNLFRVSGAGNFWTVMLSVLELHFFLAMILAVAGILLDRPLWALPLSALALLMFLFDAFAVFAEKRFLMVYAGISGGVHVGWGAWLFVQVGLAVYLLLFLDDRIHGRNPFDRSQLKLSGISLSGLSLGGWTCPVCGTPQGAGKNFCERCGAKKPEPPRCPGCGRLINSGEAFCSNCGTKLS